MDRDVIRQPKKRSSTVIIVDSDESDIEDTAIFSPIMRSKCRKIIDRYMGTSDNPPFTLDEVEVSKSDDDTISISSDESYESDFINDEESIAAEHLTYWNSLNESIDAEIKKHLQPLPKTRDIG